MQVNPSGNYETYIDSWKGEKADMDALKAMNINPHTTVNISFCSFDFSSGKPLPGLEFQDNVKSLNDIVSYIHSKGWKVHMSFGGQSYAMGPALATQGPIALAADVANIVKTYDLDGADLDIEDNPDSTKTIEFVKNLRQDLGPDKNITLTAMGQDWGWEDAIKGCAPYVDTVSFMEYNIWVPNGSTEVQRIEDDIDLYTTNWGIPPEKIQLGLMPGKDDMGRNLTLKDAKELAEFAKEKGLAGVMTWDLNRDYDGQDGNASMAYTLAIEEILGINSSRNS